MLVGLAAALLFTLRSGARDLWNPNEPLYGEAVAEMAARGDWLVPTVNGEVFDEKPILYFWLARVAAAGGGVDEWSLRLPAAASGVALVVLTFLLAVPYVGRARSFLAAFLAGTTFIVFWSARQVQMDLSVAATTLGAVLAATRVLDHGAGARRGACLAGASAGLGFLFKGPVGLIAPAIVVVAYAAVTGRLRRLAGRPLLLALAAFAAVAAPWYLALAWHGETAYLFEMLYRQNVERFVAPWDHVEPWWYYGVYFWIDMSPWSFLLPLAVGLRPRDEAERRLHRLAWVWIAGVVIFFSLSASKRSPYILPVAPAVALLVSAVGMRWRDRTLGRRRLVAGQAVLAGVGAALVCAGAWLLWQAPADPRGDRRLAAAAMALAAVALAGGATVVGLLLVRWKWPLASPLACAATVLAIQVVAAGTVLPAANVLKSARPFCEALRAHVPDASPLRGFHEWKWRASYSFYAGRPIPRLASPAALGDYWASPERVYLVVDRGSLDEAREVLGDREPLVWRAIGSNAAYLFSNAPARVPGERLP